MVQPAGGPVEVQPVQVVSDLAPKDPSVQPGEGVPPGAPEGGEWKTEQYYGNRTMAVQIFVASVHVILSFVFIGLLMMPQAFITICIGVFYECFTVCGLCDTRYVYSIDPKQQYDHGLREARGTTSMGTS
eukprot:SAG11_NODE_1676_length_4475_cov_6.069698_1_plen_130_part_00